MLLAMMEISTGTGGGCGGGSSSSSLGHGHTSHERERKPFAAGPAVPVSPAAVQSKRSHFKLSRGSGSSPVQLEKSHHHVVFEKECPILHGVPVRAATLSDLIRLCILTFGKFKAVVCFATLYFLHLFLNLFLYIICV